MDNIIGIYKITSPSCKIYIGQSVNILKRFNDYRTDKTKYSSQTKLVNSINKYGVSNHKFEIIEECIEEELNLRERYWQEFYDVLNCGLNCVLTKTTDKSGKMSEETKLKISKSNTGKIRSEDVKKLMSLNHKKPFLGKKGKLCHLFGRKVSEETKKKLSIAHKGKLHNKESKLKMSISKIGRSLSEETKLKMRESSKTMKKIINKDTGEIIFGIRQASKEIGIGYNILSDMLKGNRLNKTNLIFLENE